MAETTHNFTFMFYGFLAAWTVLMVYVIVIVSREKKIKRSMENLRRLLEDRERKG